MRVTFLNRNSSISFQIIPFHSKQFFPSRYFFHQYFLDYFIELFDGFVMTFEFFLFLMFLDVFLFLFILFFLFFSEHCRIIWNLLDLFFELLYIRSPFFPEQFFWSACFFYMFFFSFF